MYRVGLALRRLAGCEWHSRGVSCRQPASGRAAPQCRPLAVGCAPRALRTARRLGGGRRAVRRLLDRPPHRVGTRLCPDSAAARDDHDPTAGDRRRGARDVCRSTTCERSVTARDATPTSPPPTSSSSWSRPSRLTPRGSVSRHATGWRRRPTPPTPTSPSKPPSTPVSTGPSATRTTATRASPAGRCPRCGPPRSSTSPPKRCGRSRPTRPSPTATASRSSCATARRPSPRRPPATPPPIGSCSTPKARSSTSVVRPRAGRSPSVGRSPSATAAVCSRAATDHRHGRISTTARPGPMGA